MKYFIWHRLYRAVLIILLMATFLRIAILAYGYTLDSLQMDFSAFYTAGQALNHGLSPYQNHLVEHPEVWDGINLYPHSRFHYPPLAANLFQVITRLPYLAAKWVWTILEVACLGASLLVTLCVRKQPQNATHLLILGIVVCIFYPLLILLERGQVDTLTLLLLTAGFAGLATRRRQGLVGVSFALATLLKIHCIYLLPFLILRRQGKAALGMLAGGAILIAISTLMNGISSTIDYITVEIPAISNYGSGTPNAADPLSLAAAELLKSVPHGYTLKDGRVYRITRLAFDDNATLVRTRLSYFLKSFTQKYLHWEPNLMVGSLFYFGVFFSLFAWVETRRQFRTQEADASMEFLSWQIPLVIILLCAPLTWPMNCVWLLPTALLMLQESSHFKVKKFSWREWIARRSSSAELRHLWSGLALGAAILGLLLVAMPDSWAFQELLPGAQPGVLFTLAMRLLKYKYVLGELLVLVGLWGILLGYSKIETYPTCVLAKVRVNRLPK